MARLIDAKQLEKQIKEAFEDSNPVLMGQMLRWVRKQTTIDAVSVVRCKDCKHFTCRHIDRGACELEKKATGTSAVWYISDFCSYGERREGE